jgi:ATP/maltotriose-dependent transcriptional regulator MalT
MGERALTVRDRIIVHLSGFNRFADEFECPEEMCQSGISVATEKSRAHITLELNRMKNDGLVSERVAHVKGAKSKRKTYSLTAHGAARSSEINHFLASLHIEIIGPDGSKMLNGAKAVEHLISNYNVRHVIAVDRVMASGGILEMNSHRPAAPKHGAGKNELPARPDNFVPRKEMDDVLGIIVEGKSRVIVLLGIPGMGKTAMLSELAWTLQLKSNVFYRRIYTFDSSNSILSSLGEFLHNLGYPGLKKYLANNGSADLSEAGTHLAQCFERGKVILMFDEYELASSALEPFFAMLAELLRGTDSILLVASSRKPGFYSRKSVSLEKVVTEVSLGALDDAASAKFMNSEKGAKVSEENLKLAMGHPLTLKLLASGFAPANLADYVEQDILGKDAELARLCRFASVLRRPFLPDEMELSGFSAAIGIRKNLAFEPDFAGRYLLHPAISSILLAATGKRMLKELHRTAAEFYIQTGDELHETLHHLVAAGEFQHARNFVLEHEDALLSSGNQEELANNIEALTEDAGDNRWKLMGLAAMALDKAGKWSGARVIAEKIANGAPGSPESFKAMILLARILAKTGEPEDAMKVLDEILKSGKMSGEEILGQAHYSKASVLRRLGRSDAALKECEKAMSISKKLGDNLLHGQSLMESAMIMSAAGNHGGALERLDEATVSFLEKDSIQDQIRCGINTGMVLSAMERTDEAIADLEKAVKQAEENGLNRFRAHGLANLTELLNKKGDFKRSAALAQQASDIFSGLGEPVMLAVSKFNLGTALAELGKNDDAIVILDEAVLLLEKNKLTVTRGAWIRDYAELLERMGKHDKAVKILKKSK